MIRTYTFSEAGGHPANEDAFSVLPMPDVPGGWVVAVADGQGGQPGGGLAARWACEWAAAATNHGQRWQDGLEYADRVVAKAPDAGFTTLVGFHVLENRVGGASCGDSAVLAVCGSGAVTELTRLQYKNPPVGSGEAVFMPFEIELVRPWRVLAMTDGVWKYVGWPRVRELAATLGGGELLDALKGAARLPGSGQFQDDFTVVLLEANRS